MRQASHRRGRALGALLLLALGMACGSDDTTDPLGSTNGATCGASAGAPPANAMTVLGCGNFKPSRTTAEIAVRRTLAYTTTWGNAAAAASVFYIWDVSGNVPALLDSVKVDNATTLGDVAVSDDGA